jgi:hypothetical protein
LEGERTKMFLFAREFQTKTSSENIVLYYKFEKKALLFLLFIINSENNECFKYMIELDIGPMQGPFLY